MPKTLLEKIVFTVVMAAIMVYGMIVCIMCPVMSLVATVLFKEPSFGTWVHTFGCNFPMALCWQMFYCGPLSRFTFRAIFRRGEQNAQ